MITAVYVPMSNDECSIFSQKKNFKNVGIGGRQYGESVLVEHQNVNIMLL